MSLPRKAELRANADTTRAWQQRSRKRLPAKSERRSDDAERQRLVRRAVFRRDRGCQLRDLPGAGECFGGPTPHHRRKASASGAYTEANLVELCLGHNSRLESDADLADLVRRERPWMIVREGDPEWEQLGRRASGTL
jgi:hypothetical protein